MKDRHRSHPRNATKPRGQLSLSLLLALASIGSLVAVTNHPLVHHGHIIIIIMVVRVVIHQSVPQPGRRIMLDSHKLAFEEGGRPTGRFADWFTRVAIP